MKGRKKWLLPLAVTAGVLVCVYLGFAFYLETHFFYGTIVNGVDFSFKTSGDVGDYLENQVNAYTLAVIPKEGTAEEIVGCDIGIRYVESDEADQKLKKQNGFLWPTMFWNLEEIHIDVDFEIDETALVQEIQSLSCFQNEGKTEPQNARPEFDGTKYIAGKEILGTKVDQNCMTEKIEEAVRNFEPEIVLEAADCYQKPKYTSESPELLAAVDTLNGYCKASITYDMAPQTEVVDAVLISTWLSCDENLNVTFQEDMARQYMYEFAAKYETVGRTRALTTPTGKVTEVSGGTYGWAIDEVAEAEALVAGIKAGEVVTKEPIYEQRAATHAEQDWGSTFVEVDLSAQHMWFISDGNVLLETDVVTGLPYSHTTPDGVYDILNMQSPAILVGNIDPETEEPEYRTPVSYWMAVTWGGVGLHDADWQSAFGGDLYWSRGSHGCINMPVDKAGELFSMVSVGTPVVMHY